AGDLAGRRRARGARHVAGAARIAVEPAAAAVADVVGGDHLAAVRGEAVAVGEARAAAGDGAGAVRAAGGAVVGEAGVAAGAAAVHAGLGVGLAAVAGLKVAVREAVVAALHRAGAGQAGRSAVGGGADVAAAAAAVHAGLGVRLAAVGDE